jgi:hypothetical protein
MKKSLAKTTTWFTCPGLPTLIGVVALLTGGWMGRLEAQTTYRLESTVGGVFGLPLDAPGIAPGLLLRLGVVQEDPLRAYSARLALEGMVHHRSVFREAEQRPVKTFAGLGYDLRVHGTQRPVRHYFLAGAALYASLGDRGDSFPFLLLAPRIGWGGEIGFEAAIQYPGLTNFGSTRRPLSRSMFPVAINVGF